MLGIFKRLQFTMKTGITLLSLAFCVLCLFSSIHGSKRWEFLIVIAWCYCHITYFLLLYLRIYPTIKTILQKEHLNIFECTSNAKKQDTWIYCVRWWNISPLCTEENDPSVFYGSIDAIKKIGRVTMKHMGSILTQDKKLAHAVLITCKDISGQPILLNYITLLYCCAFKIIGSTAYQLSQW